jgi:peptide-methionine (S)-S-oxide reductase
MIRTFLLTTALVGTLAVFSQRGAAADPAAAVPAPAVDEPLMKSPGTETAILSGGCFWGMQLVFQHVKGVQEAVSGYTGGAAGTADYEDVSTGTTGHAESLKIVFDPSVVSYGTLLRVYFSVAADPTQLNYQYPDEGTQYRGEIWAGTAAQHRIAVSYIQQLTAAHIFSAPIVTRVDAAMPFYPAEGYHQNFATLNPDNSYIATYDAPKAAALQQLFPELYAHRAVLVPSGPG